MNNFTNSNWSSFSLHFWSMHS